MNFHRQGFQPVIRRILLDQDQPFIFCDHASRNQPQDGGADKAAFSIIEGDG
jgi:hypothetical protein